MADRLVTRIDVDTTVADGPHTQVAAAGRMPRPAAPRWPHTDTQRRDRSRVLRLVDRVGRDRLRFTSADVRRESERVPGLALEVPNELWRHLRALEGQTIRLAGRRFSAAAFPGTTDASNHRGPGTDRRGARGDRRKHTYVLSSRWQEYQDSPAALTDEERVHCALWVACVVLEQNTVPTNAVTHVLDAVPALRLEEPRQTYGLLNTLSTLPVPLCTRSPEGADGDETPGEREGRRKGKRSRASVRWRPLGDRPAALLLNEWSALLRATSTYNVALVTLGHATRNEMARELFAIAIRAARSAHWPAGRPVAVVDVRAAAVTDRRARALLGTLCAHGQALGQIVAQVTRPTGARGTRPTAAHVVRVPTPPGTRAHYDIPALAGAERRALYIPYQELRDLTGRSALAALAHERDGARRLLAASRSPAARAIALTRLAGVEGELARREALLSDLLARGHLLSAAVRDELPAIQGSLAAFRTAGARADVREDDPAECLRALGWNADELLAAPRPLITAVEYASWFPERTRRGKSPSQFLGNAKTLRRYANPARRGELEHDGDGDAPTDGGAGRRAESTLDRAGAMLVAVDRVDALLHAAETSQARTTGYVRAGAQLLGSGLRDARLPRELLSSTHETEREAAMAALTLLGDERAEAVATARLRDPAARAVDVVHALYSLLVLRRIDPSTWPEWVRRASHPVVRQAVLDVVRAAREGRWLLQR
jgi:hypothetical protein